VIALAVFAGAASVHVLLRAALRRAGARRTDLRDALWLAAFPLALALWAAALWLAGELDPAGMRAREAAFGALSMALGAPLFRLGDMPYTAVDLLLLPALLAGLWLGLGWLANGVRARLSRAFASAAPETAAMIARYALAFLGAVVIFQAYGIDLSSLALVASVLGVGIGFGLQSIAGNFVSGVLIGLERPIRPGDFVEVGGHAGTVRSIGARSTAIETLDRVVVLVPNARFLEGEVVNWSHGDPITRLRVAVTVAYGSDVGLVRAALFEAAHGHPAVLGDPRPRVELAGFGADGLEFELLVYTADPKSRTRVASELRFRLEESLRAHGVEIPLGRTDVQLHFAAAAPAGRTVEAEHAARDRAEFSLYDAALGPREWTDSALDALAARMRGAGGVALADRRWRLGTYPSCFVGREAVDWMVRNEALGRREAVEAGRGLVRRGLVRHVLDEHGFEDAHLFYRFAGDAAS
jgi:potassium efflux system protein